MFCLSIRAMSGYSILYIYRHAHTHTYIEILALIYFLVMLNYIVAYCHDSWRASQVW